MINRVEISRVALKQIQKCPKYIIDKLDLWIDAIETDGLECTMKVQGFHDEPLKGKRKGQRSIRLNKAYRAIYEISDNVVNFVLILEVNKHDY